MGNLHSSLPFRLRRPSIHVTPSRPTFSISLPVALDSESSLNREKLRAQSRLLPHEHAGYDFHHQIPATDYANKSALRATDSSKDEGTEAAYGAFLKAYPEYGLTWILDTLRAADFSRLVQRGETYVDYMGASLFPESLLRKNYEFLSQNIMGNTHSVSNTSRLSSDCADEAREAVLSFFKAPPGYTVIFTPNATGALKLVGEAYPFTKGSAFVLGEDSHNSVHGIREFAHHAGAKVSYIATTTQGGFQLDTAKEVLSLNRPSAKSDNPCLFAVTGQSNVTNSKIPFSILSYASSLGYHVIMDAAALAPTSRISLEETPVDAMVISFYKMFGYPTGVGALVVKESFLRKLRRPWFAGGNVDVVQVPGTLVTRALAIHQQFEDGTINYLTLPAVTQGIRFLSIYQPFLPLRLSCLLHFLTFSLSELKHNGNGAPVVRILSRTPQKRLKNFGEQSDVGTMLSLLFLDPSGEMLPNSFVEYAATAHSISLRTGCMCNPGGTIAILGIQCNLSNMQAGATLKDFEMSVGHELGVVRISLGLGSSFEDAWKLVRFAATLGNEASRRGLWERWKVSLLPARNTTHGKNLNVFSRQK